MGDWHIHTNYTDAVMSVAEAVGVARDLGLGFMVFSEHVRRKTTYDYSALCLEIESAARSSFISILPGAEAKILDESGSLDIDNEVLKRCRLLSMAFHTSEKLTAGYVYKAVKGAVSNWPVDIWAHPANVLCGLYESEAIGILNMASAHGVAIEMNLKYSPERFLCLLKKARLPFVVGTDSHSADEMRDRWELWLSLQGRISKGVGLKSGGNNE